MSLRRVVFTSICATLFSGETGLLLIFLEFYDQRGQRGDYEIGDSGWNEKRDPEEEENDTDCLEIRVNPIFPVFFPNFSIIYK